jgi:hypothetical protein
MKDLPTLLTAWQSAVRDLMDYRKIHLPAGTRVLVSSPRYSGIGRMTPSVLCQPDEVSVMLPDGNIWTYRITEVEPIP